MALNALRRFPLASFRDFHLFLAAGSIVSESGRVRLARDDAPFPPGPDGAYRGPPYPLRSAVGGWGRAGNASEPPEHRPRTWGVALRSPTPAIRHAVLLPAFEPGPSFFAFLLFRLLASLRREQAMTDLAWQRGPGHPQSRNIRASPQKHPMRHDGEIAHNQRTRYCRQHKHDHPAAAASTRAARPSRIRIVTELEATSLQHNYAQGSAGSCRFDQRFFRFL